KTVQRGVKELKGERARAEGRIRQAGGGRKKATETDPTLQGDLEELLEPKGDPMSLVKWTTHSLAHLVKALSQRGHRIKKSALADLLHNQGFVNVGIDHETAEFAVESIRRWWKRWGKRLYPQARELLITADGGGSNGVRNKLWKKALQTLANEEQLSITVAHYPPATVPRGTRSSTASFLSFPSIGGPNLSPLWKR